MAAIIGALRVVLGADTGEFEDGIKKASSGLKGFARDATAVAAGIKLAEIFDKVGSAIGDMIKGVGRAIDSMDKLGKEAQKIGVTTEAMSALSLAAGLSDVSIESLTKAMGRLAKGMTDADKETGEMARALKALGIDAKAFKDLTPEKQLEKLAFEFARTEDGATKTAIAMGVFGARVGQQLIPLLNSGAKGIQEVYEQAQKLNLVISKDTAKQAENFQDNLKRMSAASQGFYNVIASLVLPRLEDLSNKIVKATLDSDGFRSTAEAIGRALRFVADNSTPFLIAMGAIVAILSPLLLKFALIAAGIVFAAKALGQLSESSTFMNDFAKLLQSVGISTAALTDQTDRLKKSLDAQAEAEAKLKREMQSKEQAQIAEALRKKLESLRIETIEASNVFSRQLAPGLAQTAVQMKLVEASFFEGNKAILALPPSVQKLNEAMLGLQGMKLTQEFLTPWDQYALKLDQIDLLHQKGKITEEVRVAASQKAAMALAATYSSAAGQIAGAFGEMFTAIGGDQKDWVRASKIAMAAQALFSSFAASAEALVGPFPGNLAAAAIVLAKGLSLVAAIKGTPIGMAHGGSFNIAGPAGIDRVPVSFMATAGERVTVETPGKPRRQDSATLNVTGVRSGDYFRGDVVRDIVNGILEWQRDSGGRVLFDASRA